MCRRSCQKVKSPGKIAESHQLSIGDSKRAKSLIDEIVSRFRIHTIVIAAGSDIEQLTLGGAEEVAHAVVYLASNKDAYFTGQLPSVDGGYGI